MSLSKVIPIGSVGSLSLQESAGMVSVKVTVSQALGGGSVAGAVKASATAEVDVSAQVLIDAGLELAAAKFPAVASLLQAAKVAIDAELAKA